MTFHTHTFENGIRVLHLQNPSLIAHCGLIINVGSRDEDDFQHGLAHLTEHLIFKGTEKRKAHQIINRLESVGGELNAYTSKEETCIHCSFLANDLDRSLELITDMVFNSVFPEKELIKEKEVVIDEITSYLDNPSEQIFDDFEEIIFRGSSIGRSILGTPDHLRGFTRENIIDFKNRNYHTSKMVFCSAGDISFGKVLKYAGKHLSSKHLPAIKTNTKGTSGYSRVSGRVEKKTHQSHCIIGNIAFDLHDKRRTAMVLLNNMIGGPGLSSKLNVALRERSGFAYNVESHYTPYSDTGVFNVYFGTDKEKLNRCISIIHKEFKKLRQVYTGTIQLNRAKRQLKGQLAIGWENKESLMLAMAKSYMHFNRIDNIDQISKKIDSITAEDIAEVANIVLDPGSLSTLVYH